MNLLTALPRDFLHFWYIEAPATLITFFVSVNKAFFQLFSLPLLLRTFFQPLKNEYRQGLVRFSIVMGIIVKSCLITVNLLLLVILISIEVIVFAIVLLFPLLPIFLLFL
ncbi:MAG TPA: hypothetical protein VJC10_02945 [Patescibacteria group bacterium]|nr:hypothetical protein [Patescibacteria group bacterium]